MSVLVERSAHPSAPFGDVAHISKSNVGEVQAHTFDTTTSLKETSLLQASPYTDVLLDLSRLSGVHADVARRLAKLNNRGPWSHLDLPYPEAFNFAECFVGADYSTQLYVVVFRSTINRDALSTTLFEKLHAQDHQSYIEANEQVGGLLKYWFGTIGADRRNLATCVWTDREHATRAGKLEHHKKAVELVRAGVYEEWRIERYHLHINHGKISFEAL